MREGPMLLAAVGCAVNVCGIVLISVADCGASFEQWVRGRGERREEGRKAGGHG